MSTNAHPATDTRPPDRMDRWTRARRLYDRLLGLGLWVEAVYSTERQGGI
jgi:hypothetical protein